MHGSRRTDKNACAPRHACMHSLHGNGMCMHGRGSSACAADGRKGRPPAVLCVHEAALLGAPGWWNFPGGPAAPHCAATSTARAPARVLGIQASFKPHARYVRGLEKSPLLADNKPRTS
eukprot:143955-Chlamydomonas_euryale.AAC.2